MQNNVWSVIYAGYSHRYSCGVAAQLLPPHSQDNCSYFFFLYLLSTDTKKRSPVEHTHIAFTFHINSHQWTYCCTVLIFVWVRCVLLLLLLLLYCDMRAHARTCLTCPMHEKSRVRCAEIVARFAHECTPTICYRNIKATCRYWLSAVRVRRCTHTRIQIIVIIYRETFHYKCCCCAVRIKTDPEYNAHGICGVHSRFCTGSRR